MDTRVWKKGCGKAAYEACCLISEGEILVSVADLPLWEELPEKIRNEWDSYAHGQYDNRIISGE